MAGEQTIPEGAAGALPSPVSTAPAASLSFAQRLATGHSSIQEVRAELIELLAEGEMARDQSSCIKGALTGLRDYEKAEADNTMPALIAATHERLDALEQAQAGKQGFLIVGICRFYNIRHSVILC